MTILFYHEISPAAFDQHIKVLKRKYSIISLQDFLKWRMRSGKNLPPKPMVITFDDGHKSNFELLPIIQRHHVPVTIFLTANIIDTYRHFWFKAGMLKRGEKERLKQIPDAERVSILKSEYAFQDKMEFENRQALSKSEIERMKKTVDFQAHTITHPCLNQCSDEKSFIEIEHAKTALEEEFHLDINALAYPHGAYSDREAKYAKKAGYCCALTINNGFNTIETDLFKLKRIGINGTARKHELLVRASGMAAYIKALKAIAISLLNRLK